MRIMRGMHWIKAMRKMTSDEMKGAMELYRASRSLTLCPALIWRMRKMVTSQMTIKIKTAKTMADSLDSPDSPPDVTVEISRSPAFAKLPMSPPATCMLVWSRMP